MPTRQLQIQCRILGAIWIAAVVIVSLQAAALDNNNFAIFRTSWFNLLAGRDLYALNASHQDYFKYSPTFALLFAPFAVLPAPVGLTLWNAVNAGALWWGLGRVLEPQQALIARAVVFLDLVGSMQNVQSNALSAGLIIIAFSELERRRELRASVAIALGTLIKIFPIIAAVFAVLRPYRVPRFAAYGIGVALVLLAAPLILLSPGDLAAQYQSWRALSAMDALTRGYSVMEQLHLWFGVDWPNWPIQLLGAAILLAPLGRLSRWGVPRYRLLFLASVLMFCVLFNHKAESPTFVVALAGIALWFVVSPRNAITWGVFGLVFVGTVLSSSDAMPEILQEGFFEPYRAKTIPVLLVWLLTQIGLWTDSTDRLPRSTSAPPPAPATAPAGAVK